MNVSRKGSCSRPIDLRYKSHCHWALAWSSCVAPVTAPSRAVAAAMRSATILFRWVVEQPENEGEAGKGNASVSILRFGLIEVKVPREGVGDVVFLSGEPLGVFFDIVVGEVAGVLSSDLEADGLFDWV